MTVATARAAPPHVRFGHGKNTTAFRPTVTRLQLIREVDNVVLARANALANAYSPRCVTNGAGLFWLYVTSGHLSNSGAQIDFTGVPDVPFDDELRGSLRRALRACYNAGSGTYVALPKRHALTLRRRNSELGWLGRRWQFDNAIAAVPCTSPSSQRRPTTGYNITALFRWRGHHAFDANRDDPLGETTTYERIRRLRAHRAL